MACVRTKLRQVRGVTSHALERGMREAGVGGRSSVSGITATVFGGTGFLGKLLLFELGKTGYRAFVPHRGDMEEVRPLKVAFDLGQFAALPYSPRDFDSIKRAVEGSDVVINLVGKYYDTRHLVPHKGPDGKLTNVNYSLEATHVEVAHNIAKAAKAAGVPRFIHVSALGADESSPIRFLSSKGKGEAAVRSVFPNASIVRPGRLFGPSDRLLNWFANIASGFGVCPLVNGGDALLQPAYVADVSDAIVQIIEDEDYDGKTFELADPNNITWRELADFTFDVTYQKPRFVDLPQPAMEALAMGLQLLPNPIMTVSDVRIMGTDVVVDPSSPTVKFADMGIKPTPLEKVAFSYLHRFRKGGHFPYAQGYH